MIAFCSSSFLFNILYKFLKVFWRIEFLKGKMEFLEGWSGVFKIVCKFLDIL